MQAVFGLALSVWLCVTAWRYWRRPVPSPFEARRSEERRAWLGANPVRGALLSGVVIAAVLFATGWPKDRIVAGVVICGAFGGLIGLGLYFVFRTDPTFKPGSESLH